MTDTVVGTDPEIWYRYEDRLVSTGTTEWGESTGSRVEVRLYRYHVARRTPKGVWIRLEGWGHMRFVLNGAHKRFACPTKEEARESFLARKRRQIKIHQNIVHRAEEAMVALDRLGNKE